MYVRDMLLLTGGGRTTGRRIWLHIQVTFHSVLAVSLPTGSYYSLCNDT